MLAVSYYALLKQQTCSSAILPSNEKVEMTREATLGVEGSSDFHGIATGYRAGPIPFRPLPVSANAHSYAADQITLIPRWIRHETPTPLGVPPVANDETSGRWFRGCGFGAFPTTIATAQAVPPLNRLPGR
jgi:hypothetical protein